MHLSLSVRIAEGFLSKEDAILDLSEVATLAKSAGYEAICLRASQVGIHSADEEVQAARSLIDAHGLGVSMVTGNFDIVYNNDNGPSCLRDITPFLTLAARLQAPMIRVALKRQEDIAWAQRAADQAVDFGLKLAHQCHTLSLFETVDSIEDTLRQISRPNFGLIYEPANLQICGQEYGPTTIERLAPWMFNVYLQNQVLDEDGSVTLDTRCRGPVSLNIIQIHDRGGIDFPSVFAGLRKIGYTGTVTVHQSAPDGCAPTESATLTANFLRNVIASA